jgi:hypothetical protein
VQWTLLKIKKEQAARGKQGGSIMSVRSVKLRSFQL